MQNARNHFEAGFALLQIPFNPEPQAPFPQGCAESFKRASVLTDSNVTYSANTVARNEKR
ncbi:hypothetical protein ACOQNS_05655 [Pseudomonas asiatica]|jgi:hypothetical protein|uniref:hypothetical protein n=1 Tax=Pseudomonas asiatica TaxID=2219225 RepID=UPI001E2BD73D|nr:hypothetical protein [Pseudomonas asiatica]MCE1082551.1 hypothetical protein [Pseudomonas asiatica]